MIVKINCSVNYFNKLYTEKNENDFNEVIENIFNYIDSNNNLDVNEENYLKFNNLDFFYVPINIFEKILNDIKKQNILMTDELIVDLIEYCNYIINIDKMIKTFEYA